MKYRPKCWDELMSSRIGSGHINISNMTAEGIKFENVVEMMEESVDSIFFLLYVKSKNVVIMDQFESIYLKICRKYRNAQLTKENVSEEEIVVLDIIAAFIIWGILEVTGKDYWNSPENEMVNHDFERRNDGKKKNNT